MQKILMVLALVACHESGPAKVVKNETTKPSPPPPPEDETGTSKVISRTNTGGVIELQDDRGQAMEAANKDMSAHCGPGQYQIIQEGEEVTDRATSATAWRVHYQCN